VTWFQVSILSRNLSGGTVQNQPVTGARPKPATHCLWSAVMSSIPRRKVQSFFFFFLLYMWGAGGVQTGSPRHVGHWMAYCTCPGWLWSWRRCKVSSHTKFFFSEVSHKTGKKYSSARGKIPARLRCDSVCCEFNDVTPFCAIKYETADRPLQSGNTKACETRESVNFVRFSWLVHEQSYLSVEWTLYKVRSWQNAMTYDPTALDLGFSNIHLPTYELRHFSVLRSDCIPKYI
jgi:hypothetical protein